MKLIKMHVGGAGAKIWFGVLIYKDKSITSTNVHDNLTFAKNIYVDVNADVIGMRLRFVQQDWVGLLGVAEVSQSSYSSRIYFLL
jgi:hypothetical protein